MEKFVSLTMTATEIGKRHFLSYRSNSCYKEKNLIKNFNLKVLNYLWKNWADWINVRRDNTTPKIYFFRKRVRKLKHSNLAFNGNLTQFCSWNRNW